MRQKRARPRWICTALAAAFALALPAMAERPEPPPYYAITDARVVTGTGRILERATVVLADGLIAAVGTGVAVPADAWVIDGTGLTVYPGLIDAMSSLGIRQEEEGDGGPGGGRGGGGPGGRGGGGDGPEIRGPEDRPGTRPWVNAADLVAADDPRIESWREIGFTAAVTVPHEGFFAGRAALLGLGGDEPRQMVIATPIAQYVTLGDRPDFRNFPGSLMGRLSYVQQVLSDARHEERALALYQASPGGRERPRYDRTLAPIREAMAGDLPFLLPADLGREIDRMLEIAKDYGLRPVLYGGQGAYARVETLAERGVPVLLDLEWPEAEKDRDPDADTPFRDLYHRRMAPMTPKLLHDAGVPFAFASDGLASASEIFEGVRRAIDEGLPADAALAALTRNPARIFGVDDRVGTIETGKIANLVLSSAEPWSEDVEIKAVFVDGYRYAERASAEPSEPPAMDVGGTWKLTMQSPRGSREMTAELEMSEDGKVSGEVRGERGSQTVEKGRMSGDLLRFKTTVSMGQRTMEVSYNLTVEGENLSGRASAGPMAMDIRGERTAKAEAEKDDDGEKPTVPVAELVQALERYQGPVRTGEDFAIINARVYTLAGGAGGVGETIENGTVVVQDGKIAAVGSDVRIPNGVETIDAGGGSLIPGIIDAHSHIAIEGGGNEGSLAVTSMVTIQDVINPDDISIYRALAGGVTTVNVLHGSANPIGGGNAVLKLRWGQDADGMRFEGAPPGIKFALGENPKRSRGGGPGAQQRYPATRMGVMDVVRQAFTDARAYRGEWQAYEKAKAAGEKPIPPRRDLKLERLVEILEGERLVHAHCYRADEILQLLRLAEEQGFKIATLQHVLEGYKVADEIAAHGAGASTFSDWWGYKVEAYDAIPHNAALMAERGVLVSINSDSAEEMRHLNQEAAKAMKWGGMGELEALALVTLNPAKQLGIADRVGSIEVGKDADLTLYDGPPLSMLSIVQKTWVDGDLYFDREADQERQAMIAEIEARLGGGGGGDDQDDEDDESRPTARVSRHFHTGKLVLDEPVYSCREEH